MPGEAPDRTLHEISEAMAPGWERWRERVDATLAPVRRRLVAGLAPAEGDTVLEVAAAAGDTGFEAARVVGERGRLISTDLTPAMVAVGRRRAAELGITNAEHVVMDARRLELPDASVDGVLCRFAYMLLPDPAAGLAEARRVLRPGGRIALAVWRAPEQNPWISVPGRVAVERGHVPPPEPGAPGPFAMADERRTRALIEGAGFGGVRTEEVALTVTFRDSDDLMAMTTDMSGPMGMVLRGLPGDEREEVRRRLEEALAPFASDGGLALPGLALCATATAA